jgi:lactoylglutathione lyase
MVLTLTSAKVGGETEVRYPATFHVGFIQASEEEVNNFMPA